ncbi:protein kinase domain-containing protein [Methyloraptor flagellatus]|uniref:non-specific serine/threonine protein kinase n=1 Tax=Methyloraptor flagellatus TaxID=3162530 RepID=A0AAU7XIJ8_9HYPH
MQDRKYPFALPIGTDISGYEIERVIGAGGFGITYRATNPVTGATVAIKEFFPQGLASRDGETVILHGDVSEGSYEVALQKFQQEAAKLTSKYRHPHIVQGINFLRDNNTAYFVMDFVPGLAFDRWLNALGRPPTEAELRAATDPVLDAVDYIHRRDGMHRDLTPKNIMIRDDGRPVLVDFGASGDGLDVERHSGSFAQPNYAPPEQIAYDDGRMQGRHTDIFSLGGVLYRAVAGKPPAKPMKRSHDTALGGREADPYVPAATAAIDASLYTPRFLAGIDRALRLDPKDRPQSIPDLRQALGWDDDDRTVQVELPTVMVAAARPDPVRGSAGVSESRATGAGTGTGTGSTAGPHAGSQGTTAGSGMRGLTGSGTPAGDADAEHTLAPVDAPVATTTALRRGRLAAWAAAALIGLAVAGGGVWYGLQRADRGVERAKEPEILSADAAKKAPANPPMVVAAAPAPATPPQPAPAAPSAPAAASTPSPVPPAPATTAAGAPAGAPQAAGTAPSPTEATAAPSADAAKSGPVAPASPWRRLDGFALSGGTIAETPVSGDDDTPCRAICAKDAACLGFTLAHAVCTTAATPATLVPAPGRSAVIRTDTAAGEALLGGFDRASGRLGDFRRVEGVALPGGTLVPAATEPEACGFACAGDPLCRAWSFDTARSECRAHYLIRTGDAESRPGRIAGVEDMNQTLVPALLKAAVARGRAVTGFEDFALGGVVIGRDDNSDRDRCRAECLGDRACVAATLDHGLCERFSRVDDVIARSGAETMVDARETALAGRIEALRAKGRKGEADFLAGFDLAGTPLAEDRTREAVTVAACQQLCRDASACVGYAFGDQERQCTLFSAVSDALPDPARSSGVFRGLAAAVADTARQRLVQSEATRANYRDLPPDCAPAGIETTVALAGRPTPEQCAFLCRSAADCQGYIFDGGDRSCRLVAGVTRARHRPLTHAGLFDPIGRRVGELAAQCGPSRPPAERALITPPPGPAGPPGQPPHGAGPGGPGAECDRLAGYLYDPSLPRDLRAHEYELIDPERAIPACEAAVQKLPNVERFKVQLARALQRGAKATAARAMLKESADRGYAPAAFAFAVMAENGSGGDEDPGVAETYFRKALDGGVERAALGLGVLYATVAQFQSTVPETRIIELLTRAATGGDGLAMYRLGTLYDRGRLYKRTMPADKAKAEDWYRRANAVFMRDAEHRDIAALRFLSFQYDFGRGTPQNTDLAVRTLLDYLSVLFGPQNANARKRGSIGDFSFDDWSLDTRKGMQAFLKTAAGLEDELDGKVGPKTREALERWLGLR